MRRSARLTTLSATALATFGLAGVAITGTAAAKSPARSGTPAFQPSQWVDPFIGTAPGDTDFGTGGGGGNVQPAAEVPFGMTQFGPRTEDPSTSGGYDHRSTTISGFPLTALSGAGCQDYNDFPIQPFVGDLTASPEKDLAAYRSSFDHASESASPGYYGVTLDKPQTKVEITAAKRANLARFTFPRSDKATLMIRSSVESGGSRNASFQVTGPHTIVGTVSDGGFCGSNARYTLHFAASFNRNFTAHGTWSGDNLHPGRSWAKGGKSGAYLRFDTTQRQTVTAKVAISWVDEAGARRNLAADAPDFDFNAMRAAAKQAWDRRLGRVKVGGGTTEQKRIFYTALYHTMVVPNTVSDSDGRYRGFDFKTHQTSGWTQYGNYSGWDVYRSWFSLTAIDSPRVASDFAQSLVVDGEQGGALPKWSTAMDEANVMTGDPGPPGVASAYAFGARRFDTASALKLMLKSALQPGVKNNQYEIRQGLQDYLDRGYIPMDPSTTLEDASSDFAISSFARALGDDAHADLLEAHSQNWQNLFNPGTGYVQPRTELGSFASPFDPGSNNNYVEGNAAQYTWMIPHNPAGLIAALGGEQAATARLDQYFTKLNAGPSEPYAFMGNEPSFNDAWLYNWVGQPAKTQAIARRTTLELFRDEPGGLVGNDDLGASSGWHVLGAIGLYPAIPGVGGLTVGSPLFPKITIKLRGGHKLVIKAPDASATTPYVQSLKLDGRKIQRTWLDWKRLSKGATLKFNLGPQPTKWAQNYRPPSFQGGQDAGIGYLTTDAAYLAPGESTTFSLGVQNLRDRALTVTWSPDLPSGVTLTGPSGSNGLTIPAGARKQVTLTVKAAADAADGAKVVDLGLKATDGSQLPPAVLRVAVARPGDLVPYMDNAGVSRDAHPGEGNFDSQGWSYSADALAAKGITPGSTVPASGFAFAWPSVAAGQPDNITAAGQVLRLEPKAGATALGFLGSASNGPSKGDGTITYTDGSTQAYTLDLSDWTLGAGGSAPEPGNAIAASTPYRNNPGGRDAIQTNLFAASVPLQAGKTVRSVTLPSKANQGALHVFAIAQK
jgi:predicted alpha-1,2-mannosidase